VRFKENRINYAWVLVSAWLVALPEMFRAST